MSKPEASVTLEARYAPDTTGIEWRPGDLAEGELVATDDTGTEHPYTVLLRYGTSPLGPGWEVVGGDLFGYVPLDMVANLRPHVE